MKESDLYWPLKTYLEKQGYTVNSEVKNCDIVARKDNELVIVELKKNFSVDLLIQAVQRKEITHSVYVAIPVSRGKKIPPKFSGIKVLLRRLEIGLILVHFMKTKTKLETIMHPKEYHFRRQNKKRFHIIREIEGRYKEFNIGGSAAGVEKITAYKQCSIKIAYYLNQLGQASPRQLAELGTGPKTNPILYQNIYGWFDRVKRGVYTLNAAGKESLLKYPQVIKIIENH